MTNFSVHVIVFKNFQYIKFQTLMFEAWEIGKFDHAIYLLCIFYPDTPFLETSNRDVPKLFLQNETDSMLFQLYSQIEQIGFIVVRIKND